MVEKARKRKSALAHQRQRALEALPKGILKKEGVTYPRKSRIVFKEDLIEPDPPKLSQPKWLTDNLANEMEQENFQRVWMEVSSKKLHYAARILQKFARKHMLCWIITNDRRTELYEELDYIEERLAGDLERIEWEKEDMQQEADLEIQAERENAPPGEYNQVKEDIKTIRSLQTEIRNLKAENEKLKVDSKTLKKANKQLGYDLKEKAPAVEMGKTKVEMLESHHRKIKRNHDQFPPNVKKWQDSLEQMNTQLEQCQKQGHMYRDACLKALEQVKLRYPRKRVLKPIMEIMHQDFANYHPVPTDDDQKNGVVAPAPFQRSVTTGSARVGRVAKKPDSTRRASSTGMADQRNSKSPLRQRKEKKKISKTTSDSEVGMVNKLKASNSPLLQNVVEEASDDEVEAGQPKTIKEEELEEETNDMGADPPMVAEKAESNGQITAEPNVEPNHPNESNQAQPTESEKIKSNVADQEQPVKQVIDQAEPGQEEMNHKETVDQEPAEKLGTNSKVENVVQQAEKGGTGDKDGDRALPVEKNETKQEHADVAEPLEKVETNNDDNNNADHAGPGDDVEIEPKDDTEAPAKEPADPERKADDSEETKKDENDTKETKYKKDLESNAGVEEPVTVEEVKMEEDENDAEKKENCESQTDTTEEEPMEDEVKAEGEGNDEDEKKEELKETKPNSEVVETIGKDEKNESKDTQTDAVEEPVMEDEA